MDEHLYAVLINGKYTTLQASDPVGALKRALPLLPLTVYVRDIPGAAVYVFDMHPFAADLRIIAEQKLEGLDPTEITQHVQTTRMIQLMDELRFTIKRYVNSRESLPLAGALGALGMTIATLAIEKGEDSCTHFLDFMKRMFQRAVAAPQKEWTEITFEDEPKRPAN